MKRLLVAATVILCLSAGLGYWWISRFDSLIREKAEKYQLDFYLVKSLIWEESAFNASARGASGEFGLMQVMPYVGEEYWQKERGISERPYQAEWLLLPEHNLEVGCWYLRDSLDMYREMADPLPFALARYNAGHVRVSRWMKQGNPKNRSDFLATIDFPSTRAYVQRVLERSERRSSLYLW